MVLIYLLLDCRSMTLLSAFTQNVTKGPISNSKLLFPTGQGRCWGIVNFLHHLLFPPQNTHRLPVR